MDMIFRGLDMAKPCGAKCAKYTLITFNLVFFVSGLAVLGVGIWILVDKANFVTLTARVPDQNADLSKYKPADTVMHQAAYLLIAAGIISLVMAFLGCCGAMKEWRGLLITYAVFLMIILGLEIAAGIYAGVFRNTAYDYIRDTMALTLRKQYQGDGLAANGMQVTVQSSNVNFWTTAWDMMMVQLECCGLNDGNDFLNPLMVESYRPKISGAPVACCKFRNAYSLLLVDETCGSLSRVPTLTSFATNYNQGCLPKLNEWIDVNLRILLGVGIGIGLIQIFGIVFAFILCMAIQSDKNEVH